MRILHLLNDIADQGNGINNVTVDLACAQADAGHEVFVASAGGHWEALLAQHGVQHRHVVQSRTPFSLATAPFRLRQLFRKLRPDVVHAHNITGVVLVAISKPFRTFPLVTTVHREEGSIRLMGMADAIIVLSDDGRKRLTQRGMRADRIRVLRNGTIGGARAAARSTPEPLKLRQPAIVSVCGLYPRKGVHDLLDAMVVVRKAVPEVAVYIVGDGPYGADLRAKSQALGLGDCVTFEGFQSRPDRWLAEAQVFVLASHAEPGALVLIEAREAGVAIVATNVDGNPGMLDGGRAGEMVSPGKPLELAAVLERLLKDPPELQRLRAASRQGIEDLTVQRLAIDVERIYQEACHSDSPLSPLARR